MTKLLIGCPIYKREWIFPYWISCIENQEIDLSKIGFVFEVSPDDESTISTLTRYRNARPSIDVFEIDIRNEVVHFEHKENTRSWSISKYSNMVFLRNKLLQKVREINPDYFFSLDSDILITNSNTINYLASHVQDGADAVSPLMFMTPNDTMYPSVMNWVNEPGGQGYREEKYPLGQYFKSDVIMAAKFMSRKTYSTIDYDIHSQGEDLGWCANAAKAGLKLFCASYVYAPHIMHKSMLEYFLRHGDPRQSRYLEMS
jgi:hypothetical protein